MTKEIYTVKYVYRLLMATIKVKYLGYYFILLVIISLVVFNNLVVKNIILAYVYFFSCYI